MGHDIYPNGGAWPIPQAGRSRTIAENDTLNVITVGDYDGFRDRIGLDIRPGSYFAIGDESIGVPDGGFAIRTVTLRRDESYGSGLIAKHVGVLELALVHVTGPYDPFEVTVDVDIREVGKGLITHPDIQGDGVALNQIRLWNETPEGKRVSYVGGMPIFRYYEPKSEDADGEESGTLKPVDNENAQKYLLALTAGIETYSVYLPVVTRIRRFVRLPGDGGSGTITLPYNADLGGFVDASEVPECPAGFETGLWFKSADRYSRASDGVWTQTEEWTYTDDSTHDWIYKEL